MIDSKLRKYVQPGFDFVGKNIAKSGITANQLTILAFLLGIIASTFIALNKNILGLCVLLLSGFFDVIDGTVARINRSISDKGAFLDLIFDRLIEAFLIMGLAIAYPEHYISYIAFLILVIFNFTTFLIAGSLIKNQGEKSIHYDPGIAERTETFICFSLILVFPSYIFYILNFFNLIILLTGIIRFKNILGLLK